GGRRKPTGARNSAGALDRRQGKPAARSAAVSGAGTRAPPRRALGPPRRGPPRPPRGGPPAGGAHPPRRPAPAREAAPGPPGAGGAVSARGALSPIRG